jgi:hypothetical protein
MENSKKFNEAYDDKNEKYYIKIHEIEDITNGSPDILSRLEQPNAIGKVIQKETHQEICEITPLTMIINQSSRNVQEQVNALLKAGANPDLEITYYNNQKTTARKLALLHRKNIEIP